MENGRICNECQTWKPWEAYYKAPAGRNGRMARCKQCIAAYYARNRKDRIAYQKAYNRTHWGVASYRNRGGTNVHPVSYDDLMQLLERQNNRCNGCGSMLDISLPTTHLDHIVPVSRGGDHCLDNIQFLCANCNMDKGNRTMSEWKAEAQA